MNAYVKRWDNYAVNDGRETRAKVLAEIIALRDECFATCKTQTDYWVCCEDFWIRLQSLADKSNI